MKSHKSRRELLIIRLICYSFIAWVVTYVYLNSWTGINVNKLEQDRIDRIQKKAALKKSLDVLIEAGFSDNEVLGKQIELLTYFLGEKEIDESKKVLDSMDRTLATSTTLSCGDKVRAKCLLMMGKQYMSDFQRAAQIALSSKEELSQALAKKEIDQALYEKLKGIIQNNLAVTQFLQSSTEEELDERKKLLTKSITSFAQAEKMFKANANNTAQQKITSENLAAARREILFDQD